MGNGKKSIFDPRAGLWILITANIIAFSDHTLWVELALIALLLVLMIVHRRYTMAVKWAVGYCALLVFQHVILPASPMIIATSFTIFATYHPPDRSPGLHDPDRSMLKCTPLRYLIVRAAAVTYSPEADCGYIRDAAVLPRYPGGDRPHPGRDETAEYPGTQPFGVYGDAPHGVRYGDGRGALCGGRDPRNRKIQPERPAPCLCV